MSFYQSEMFEVGTHRIRSVARDVFVHAIVVAWMFCTPRWASSILSPFSLVTLLGYSLPISSCFGLSVSETTCVTDSSVESDGSPMTKLRSLVPIGIVNGDKVIRGGVQKKKQQGCVIHIGKNRYPVGPELRRSLAVLLAEKDFYLE